MADIELDNIGEDRTEQERAVRAEEREEEGTDLREETSFTENTDNIRSVTQSRVNTGLGKDDFTDLERQIQDHAIKKAIQRYDAIQALETATDTKFKGIHGDNSKELVDYISDAKYNENGKLIALKFKGEDIKQTGAGKIDKRYEQNKGILRAIEKAMVDYNTSIASVIDESADSSMSDEVISSVQENVIEELESFIDDRYKELSLDDPDKNIRREINGIMHVDDNIDYDDLSNPNQVCLLKLPVSK